MVICSQYTSRPSRQLAGSQPGIMIPLRPAGPVSSSSSYQESPAGASAGRLGLVRL